ncbi:hypothetical protein GUJ93_ZPchr0013g37964 [Zizania palustris]|uniref:Uncharacterized protein n=1 Tax=Zizania palustris TaxID=103762 RepID=A0A8J5WVM0_ZIZPA|nr:hypothetical protein GUJ93_ZPchr0013g37964 [Zizania palustris]
MMVPVTSGVHEASWRGLGGPHGLANHRGACAVRLVFVRLSLKRHSILSFVVSSSTLGTRRRLLSVTGASSPPSSPFHPSSFLLAGASSPQIYLARMMVPVTSAVHRASWRGLGGLHGLVNHRCAARDTLRLRRAPENDTTVY